MNITLEMDGPGLSRSGGTLGVGDDENVEAGTARDGIYSGDFDIDAFGVGAGNPA
jgi:hypothetical protein